MIPDTTQFPAFLAGVAQGRLAGLEEAAKVCDDGAGEGLLGSPCGPCVTVEEGGEVGA